MELLNVLYITLIICTVLITGAIIAMAYHAKLTLEQARISLVKVENLLVLPDVVKNSVEAGVFGFAGWILQKLQNRR